MVTQYLELDTEFTSEEKMIRDSVAAWAKEQVMPHMIQDFEAEHFPSTCPKQLADLGILGMCLPEEHAGVNASSIAYGLVCQELEYCDSSLRSFVSVQNSLVMYPIYKYGSSEQHKLLPKLAQAEVIGCFGLTEADSGSNPMQMRTTATKDGDGWLLQGNKMWITNASIADVAIVWAKTEDGVRGFVVPKDTKGFSQKKISHKLSLRASVTGELNFTNCWVPDSCLLPGTECGLKAALSCLNEARFGIAWGALGAADACYQCALDYVTTRMQAGKPLAAKQLIQRDLAQMITAILTAKCFNLQISKLKNQDKCHYTLISMAKSNACNVALKVARMARDMLGANGISLEYPVIRHMNNLESVTTYEGTNNIHHLILGRAITGINAF